MWHYTTDQLGEQLAATDPTGSTVQATYDDLGRLATSTQVERHGFDPAGNPLPGPVDYTTSYRYDDAGDLTTLTHPSGWASTAGYNAAGEPTAVSVRPGQTTQFSYGLDGVLTKVTDGLGASTAYSYDLAGRLTQAADLDATGATLRTRGIGIDPAGNVTSTTDPLGHTTSYSYDSAKRLTQMVEPVDGTTSITTSFGYDAAGNQTRYTDGRGNSTVTTYNTLGLPESVIEPSTPDYPDAVDRTYTTGYDAAGQPTAVTEPGGVTQSSSYDELGPLIGQTGAGAEAVTASRVFGYDLVGRMTSASAPGGTDTFGYDDRGDLLSTAGPSGTATFAYDADGNLARRVDAAGTATFDWVDGQLHQATDPVTGDARAYQYDPAGQLSSVLFEPSSLSGYDAREDFGYDPLHRLTSQQVTANRPDTVPEPVLASIGYGYDLADHLTSKTTAGTAGAGTSTYGYDQAGRLTSATTGGVTTTYGWDASGNRTQAGATTATYDARDRLLAAGGTTYSYTARGTRSTTTSGGVVTGSAFDAFDQVATAGSTAYSYDALGRVVARDGVGLSYSGLNNQVAGDGTAVYSRDPFGVVMGIGQGGDALTALTDLHGDLVGTFHQTDTALVDSTGYDPFGQVTAIAGTHRNIGFQGGWTDPDTGAVDMAARWYDPSAGGFTSRDTTSLAPVPSVQANRYGYGAANPLTNADPTGHSAAR